MLDISSANFENEVVKSVMPVLVDFWADWCAPCKIIAPVVEELAKEFDGKVKVAKSNVDQSPELATELSVLNIPTLILFKDGNEVSRIIGVNSKEAIKAKINTFVD